MVLAQKVKIFKIGKLYFKNSQWISTNRFHSLKTYKKTIYMKTGERNRKYIKLTMAYKSLTHSFKGLEQSVFNGSNNDLNFLEWNILELTMV